MDMVWRLARKFAFILTMVLSHNAFANDTEYLDDRSTAQALIASYFNALNSHEFARAWSYWDNEMPGSNFEDFVEGYTGVTSIQFKLGKSFSEGAAGSTFTQVPLAVVTQDEDGWSEVYAGCFLLRLAQPTIQSPPFTPLHFWDGHLSPVESTFDETETGECEY